MENENGTGKNRKKDRGAERKPELLRKSWNISWLRMQERNGE